MPTFKPLKLRLGPRFQSDIRTIPQHAAVQLLRDIAAYAAIGEGDVKKLHGVHQWRIRSGEYRARFTITEDGFLDLTRAGHRRDIYR